MKIKETIDLLKYEFVSSCSRTPQYLRFHRIFKKEFTTLLKPYTKEILIHKPNHFNVSGFFKLQNDKIYYISISDLRTDKKTILIRTATDFKDYSGGCNTFIPLNNEFEINLFRFLEINE